VTDVDALLHRLMVIKAHRPDSPSDTDHDDDKDD
jgi:hypothetical protein